MTTINFTFQQILDLFTQQNSWEERYRQLILLGKNLEKPENLDKLPIITGCESTLWFEILPQTNSTYYFIAYSEARILNGLLVILLTLINGKTAEQLKSLDITAILNQLGIAQRLSDTRLNGLKNIEKKLHSL